MAHLLDADVLITAKRDHYRFAVFPCFWDWLLDQFRNGRVYSVAAIRGELEAQEDELTAWVAGIPDMFLDPDEAVAAAAARVSEWAVHPDRPYRQDAVNTFFASGDYWLIAHALAHGHVVVTHETRAPDAIRRIKIPDVCDALGVTCTTPFDMLQSIGANFTRCP